MKKRKTLKVILIVIAALASLALWIGWEVVKQIILMYFEK